MKIIDLLNKIANEEEVPKEIKYNACLFAFERQSQDYYCEEYGNLFEYLINEHRTGEFLNDEVEIIEEDKKIEKIKQRTDTGLFGSMVNDEIRVAEAINKQANYLSDIVSTINEIIDYLEEK